MVYQGGSSGSNLKSKSFLKRTAGIGNFEIVGLCPRFKLVAVEIKNPLLSQNLTSHY